MAIVPMTSPMPLTKRLAPMKNSVIRYSDVAHYVGLSLLHDPKLVQPRRKYKRDEVTSRYLEEDDGSDIQSTCAASLPNLHDRAELLRIQIRHLKAEQRTEKEHMKKLEHTLSDIVAAEQKAHQQADRRRQERDQQKEHLSKVETRIKQLQTESRAQSAASSPFMKHDVDEFRRQSSLGPDESIRRANNSFNSFSSIASTTRTGSQKTLKASRSNLTLASIESSKPKIREMTLEKLESFTSEAELTHYQREAVRDFILQHVGNPVQAFNKINVNGSGRISSMEFADGMERLRVPWKQLTGLNKSSDFFRLFAAKKSGVVTFRDLFPVYEEPKDERGYDTESGCDRFWAKYEGEDFVNGHGDLELPKWESSCANDGLKVLYERERKDFEAAFTRKWMTTTMRRMKARGKSDARCREMVALHLPKGTGPIDLHGVPTISDHDVKQMRQQYLNQMKGPQRKCQQHIYDLHACRKDLLASKHSFYHVVTEPVIQKKLMEDQAKQAKSALGGLAGALIHKHDEPVDFNDHDDEESEELSVDSEVKEELQDIFEDATEQVSPLLSSQ